MITTEESRISRNHASSSATLSTINITCTGSELNSWEFFRIKDEFSSYRTGSKSTSIMQTGEVALLS